MNLQDWHIRYTLQARWTHDLRRYLSEKAHLDQTRTILEVGCGTGAVLASLPEFTPATLHGLDIDFATLSFARTQTPASLVSDQGRLVNGDAFHLPYAPASFDAVCCHYLLLWLPEPVLALEEMHRVLRPGGSLLVFAEPDYGGRIDHPEELPVLGEWQSASLQAQGADPRAGRQLSSWLHAAGFTQAVTGILGGEWTGEFNQAEFDSEWEILRTDVGRTFSPLSDVQPPPENVERTFSPPTQGGLQYRPTLDELQSIDKNARLSGERVLYVPTFYALSTRPISPDALEYRRQP